FVVTCKPLGLHVSDRLKIMGCRDLAGAGAGGLRGRRGHPSAKRRPLSVVPDARRAGVNIKKLPLISHKAAVNGLDHCKVPGAQTWGPHQWATTTKSIYT